VISYAIVRTDPATCSLDTGLSIFRAVVQTKGARGRVTPNMSIFDVDLPAYNGESMTMEFPTFADVCAFLRIQEKEREELTIQIKEPTQSNKAMSTTQVTGREIFLSNKDGKPIRHIFVGRTSNLGCEKSNDIVALVEEGAHNVATLTPENFVWKKTPQSELHRMLAIQSCQYIVRWTRTTPTNTPPNTPMYLIMGKLTVEIPLLIFPNTNIARNVQHAFQNKSSMCKAIHDSPFNL